MLRGFLSAVAVVALAPLGGAQTCAGGVAVSTFRLTVAPPAAGGAQLPMRQVNNLPAGYRIRYQPRQLPPNLDRDARLTLVMVPTASDGQITVLEPRSLASATEWLAPFAARIVLLVFAPQGLDEKRLVNLVTRDEALVAALADYADQTAGLESGLEALNAVEDTADDDGAARALTPTEQTLMALVRALNPAIAAYNPLGAGRRVPAATLMGKGADAFFQNAGGLVPGGGILPAVKTWLMPDTEFRAVYGLPGEAEAMTLCAQIQARSRNRMAYVWAYRLAAAAAPSGATVDADVPLGARAAVPLRLRKTADWQLLERAYDWTLVPESASGLRVRARAASDERLLRLDLRGFAGAPGSYRLEAHWDWDTLRVDGQVRVHRAERLEAAQVAEESQDKLIAASGPVALELRGADFAFVEKAALHRPGSSQYFPAYLPPGGARADRLTVEIDTDGLRPGEYRLALSQTYGPGAEVPLRVLPPPPRIAAPVRVHAGEREQTVVLTGAGLDRIIALESAGAGIELKPATNEGSTRREASVRLTAAAAPGDLLAASARVEGMSLALPLPGLLQVLGSRPRVRGAQASLPRDLAVTTREGELPAGSWINFAVVVEPPGIQPSLAVQCAEASRAIHTEILRAGEKRAGAQWTPAGETAWFLALDPGALGQSGCTLQATLETESLGKADPFPLGKVVRLPRITSFSLTDQRAAEGFVGSLAGFDLETIEKTGWNAQAGVAVPELPRPVAGEGGRQTLRIVMPWPSPTPKAPLYIWLRGEAEGRPTLVTQ